ncbi:MAG TPA: hypothetical protein VFI44_03575 [Ornithinibacter sp.]|nr:hypothetical protein [Ornithinibacter sp.]
MDVLRRIAAAPGDWTAEGVLDGLPVHLPPDAAPRDLPDWLREVSLLSDAAANIGSTTFLVWWQDAAPDLLPEVMAAFRAVGLGHRADLLDRARRAVDPRELAPEPTGVGLFGLAPAPSRVDAVAEEGWAVLAEVEEALRRAEESGPALYDVLLAHAAAGLSRPA